MFLLLLDNKNISPWRNILDNVQNKNLVLHEKQFCVKTKCFILHKKVFRVNKKKLMLHTKNILHVDKNKMMLHKRNILGSERLFFFPEKRATDFSMDIGESI